MQWREVVDELANALRIALCYAANARRDAQTLVDDAVRLEASIAHAESILKTLCGPARKRSTR